MASGLFAKAALPMGTTRLDYTAPVGFVTTLNILLGNYSQSAVTVSLYVGTGSIAINEDFIERYTVRAGTRIEHTGLVVNPGEGAILVADAVGLAARMHGFEEKL